MATKPNRSVNQEEREPTCVEYAIIVALVIPVVIVLLLARASGNKQWVAWAESVQRNSGGSK